MEQHDARRAQPRRRAASGTPARRWHRRCAVGSTPSVLDMRSRPARWSSRPTPAPPREPRSALGDAARRRRPRRRSRPPRAAAAVASPTAIDRQRGERAPARRRHGARHWRWSAAARRTRPDRAASRRAARSRTAARRSHRRPSARAPRRGAAAPGSGRRISERPVHPAEQRAGRAGWRAPSRSAASAAAPAVAGAPRRCPSTCSLPSSASISARSDQRLARQRGQRRDRRMAIAAQRREQGALGSDAGMRVGDGRSRASSARSAASSAQHLDADRALRRRGQHDSIGTLPIVARPSRSSPAAASKVASASPAASLASRVSTLPRNSTIAQVGPPRAAAARARRGEEVPTTRALRQRGEAVRADQPVAHVGARQHRGDRESRPAGSSRHPSSNGRDRSISPVEQRAVELLGPQRLAADLGERRGPGSRSPVVRDRRRSRSRPRPSHARRAARPRTMSRLGERERRAARADAKRAMRSYAALVLSVWREWQGRPR